MPAPPPPCLPRPHLPVEKDDSAVVANIPVHHRPANRREDACLHLLLHKRAASRGSGANYSHVFFAVCLQVHAHAHTGGHRRSSLSSSTLFFSIKLYFRLCVCVHSCMHVVCAHIDTHEYICTHIYIHTYTNLCAYVYVCPHGLVHVCTDLLELQLQVVGTYKYIELNSECTQHMLVTIKPSLKLLRFIFLRQGLTYPGGSQKQPQRPFYPTSQHWGFKGILMHMVLHMGPRAQLRSSDLQSFMLRASPPALGCFALAGGSLRSLEKPSTFFCSFQIQLKGVLKQGSLF